MRAPKEREDRHANGHERRLRGEDPNEAGGYSEITLADIVNTLQRRKFVLVAVFLVVLLAGVGVTAATTPEYESSASVIPLEHTDIIRNWLDSRQAAREVITITGDPLLAVLFPDRFDEATGTWDGPEPSMQQAARRLQESTSLSRGTDGGDRYLELTVRLTSASVARDAAQGYVESLDVLRPHLENITRQEVFPDYYDGTNEQEARRLAEVEARQKEYWIPLDEASMPASAVVPNTTLNLALATVLGLMLGVFAVFFVEWVSSYRAQTQRRVDVPAPPRAADQEEPRSVARETERVQKAPVRRYR